MTSPPCLSTLRHTADGILRDLDNYQESREEIYLSSLATRIARLFQEIARITTVQAQMRAARRNAAKDSQDARPTAETWSHRLAELRSMRGRASPTSGGSR